MAPAHRRVAVIGAGPAGAIATDALVKEQAFETVRIFDRRAGIGGTWIHTPHLPASIPSLKEVLAGTADKPIALPPLLPAVTPVSEEANSHQLRFSDTAIHENLHSNITPQIMSYSSYPFPNTLSSRSLAEYGPGAPFRHHATISDWVEGIFKSNGYEKLVELTQPLSRVVVVGASVSSHEIIHEILEAAESPVYSAIRGEPIPAFGWEPFDHPKIVVKKEVTRLDAKTGTVHFADGRHLENVDHVIFGTGYTFSYPFLPHIQERLKNAYRRLPGVWQHTWDIEDPSLTFVGMLGGGFTFRVDEYQAVAVARHLAGRAAVLPPITEQLEWERARAAEKKGGKDYYSIAPNYSDFFELLRSIAGEPAEGTTGRKLEPFREDWTELWQGMVSHKIEGWRRKRRRAQEELDAGRV
ncbi:thiol-specific monooxygenase [Seiridium cupressi]